MSPIKKILIIRLSSLGDILLTSPLLREIKNRFPDCLIDFVIKKEFIQAIEFNPNLNNILLYEANNVNSLKKKFNSANYDYILDLQNNFRSRQLLKGMKSQVQRILRIYKFKKPTFKKFLLVNFKINLLKDKLSIAQRYVNSFPLIKSTDLQLDFHYPIDKDADADSIFPRILIDKKIIGICPGSKHFTKRYPSELFAKLISELSSLNYSIFLFGGIDDKTICTELVDNSRIFNFQNDNDLYLTAAMMKKCFAIISNDSALMHLSCALNVPTAAIFGSTVSEFGFSPLNKKSVIIENNDLNCRPCTHIGRNDCPKKHFKCMKDISPDIIISKLQPLMKNE